jgi:hypothetical protein
LLNDWKVTVRHYEKLVKKAEFMFYTKDELKLLEEMIDGHCDPSEENVPNDVWSGVTIAIYEYLNYGGISVNMDSDWFLGYERDISKKLNFSQFLLVYYRKIFLFLSYVSLDQVALYLNKKPLTVFCLWRYKIGR